MKLFTFSSIAFSIFICIILWYVPIKKLLFNDAFPVQKSFVFYFIKGAMFAGLVVCTLIIAVASVWFCINPSTLMLVNIACNIIALALSASIFSFCYDKKSPF